MTNVGVFDSKPYDKTSLLEANKDPEINLHFFEFHLNEKTALTAEGMDAVSIFVNDALDEECLKTLKKSGVKLITLRCAGYNNVDLKAAKELKIDVTRVPAYSPHAVAEHTIGLLLTLNRKIHKAYNRVRELNFSLNGLIGFDLFGKTAGIIGTGKIGKIVAEILRGFGVNVLAYDLEKDLAWSSAHGIEYTDLATLLSSSDIISLHVPLVKETYHLIDEKAFSLMKQGVFIINTSRGKVIHTKALINALKEKKLGGVALDVYEEEEGLFFEDHSEEALLDDELSRLLTFPNVLLTAHQAFLTREALKEIGRITIENIKAKGRGGKYLEGTSLVESQ